MSSHEYQYTENRLENTIYLLYLYTNNNMMDSYYNLQYHLNHGCPDVQVIRQINYIQL